MIERAEALPKGARKPGQDAKRGYDLASLHGLHDVLADAAFRGQVGYAHFQALAVHAYALADF